MGNSGFVFLLVASLVGMFLVSAGIVLCLLEHQRGVRWGRLGSTRLLVVGGLLSSPFAFSLAIRRLPW